MRLKDKVAIVTGGAYGLGRAYAMGYSNEGAKVVIADIDFEGAKACEAELAKKGKEAIALRVDVASVDDTLSMAKKTLELFGKIDILMNNAAVLGRAKISRNVPFYELNLDEWDRVMAVNVKGVLLCCRAVFPYMKTQGRGKIITVSTGQFHNGGAGGEWYAHYIASKGAIIGLTRALARELGQFNINVNCIAPGATLSEDPNDPVAVKFRQGAVNARCFKRIEYPEDLVGTAIFLSSSDSDFITGQTIAVNGGVVML